VTSEAIGVPGGVASADVSVLTTQAEPGLANATNLGDLSSGLLKIIVTLGVATILNANIADTAHACVLTTAGPTALTLPTTGTLAVLSDIPAPYTLPIATAGSLGGIRVGSGLSIDGDGILSATGGGSGTVTSVGLALPSSEFDTTGGTNPVTGSGTLTGTWKTQTANYGFMGPASGAAAAPAFRALVAADIPGSTVGKAVLALTNPDAVSFPRFNADNTVDALSAANFRTAIGAGTSSFDGAYASLSGKPTLGTASAQDVGYFATAAQAFPGFGTTHALAAYGDHAHAGVYEPAIGYVPAQASVNHANAHAALAVGGAILTGISHGAGATNYHNAYGCGLGFDRAAYTSSSCVGSFRLDSPDGGADIGNLYLDSLITYTDPATQVWTGPQKIWTDYNDGSGSGLDADLLKGSTWASPPAIGGATPNVGNFSALHIVVASGGNPIQFEPTDTYTTAQNETIRFFAKYNALGTYTQTAGIKLSRTSTSDGGYDGMVELQTRATGGSLVTRLSVDSGGLVNISALTASRAVLTDASENLVSSTITSTELEAIASGRDAILASNPGDPTATSSTTEKMMGINKVVTPLYSTRLMVVITGVAANTTAAQGYSIKGRYGTGAAPANGASATGTQFGVTTIKDTVAAGVEYDFCIHCPIAALTPNTTYWFDLGLNARGSGAASVKRLSISIVAI
jgi:hypothetical protein